LSHLVIVPSKIDSPIWGMITSVGMDSLSQLPKTKLIFPAELAAQRGFLF
jgi:hypothetical protein